MSRIRADRIVNRAATGAPDFPNGATVTGVVTATSFSGSVNATGLTGTPDITVNNIVGAAATFNGVLTYEDVANVDSVGLITARTGLNVLAGGVDLKGVLQEKVVITSGKLSDNLNIDLDTGMVHYFTTAESTTSIPNIRTATGINTDMATGDTISVTIITTAASAGYGNTIKIDGSFVGAPKWVGGTAPTAGGSSGLDMYSYQIIKTGSAAYTVIGNLTNAA